MFLAIEIGGTKLQVALGDGQGQIHALHRVAADPTAGAEGIRRQIMQASHALLERERPRFPEVLGCGIGFGGPVDDADGSTITSHQVDGWENFPLTAWAERELAVPCVVGNDADVAGLAEATMGAGTGGDPVFYMNVGSGIGGALILGGKIHRGAGLGAGEIGHLWIDYNLEELPDSPPIASRWSILEHRASGWAMQKAAHQPDVPTLLQAMTAGDETARGVWIRARRRLALALTHVIALVCPQRIVLGGGVSLADESMFLSPLREEVARLVFRPFAGCYDIRPAALGETVVVQGALALARQRFQAR
jgi:glucokinase